MDGKKTGYTWPAFSVDVGEVFFSCSSAQSQQSYVLLDTHWYKLVYTGVLVIFSDSSSFISDHLTSL